VRKILTRALVSLAVLLAAAMAGVYLSAGLAPERLRAEVEQLLARGTGGPASMGTLRLVMGFPVRLEATDLRLWDGALTIDTASARVDVLSLLTGRPRLRRLAVEGAHLRIQRAPGERGAVWSPRPFTELAERAGRKRREPLLGPLHGIEATVRFLLSEPRLADTLEVRRSRVSYVHDFSDSDGEIEATWFTGVHGSLRHSRLRGRAELFLSTRLVAQDGPRGSVEWEGTRSRDGAMRISMAVTELELSTVVPYVSEGRRDSRLHGRLSGIADFLTSTPGAGRLSLDLAVRDFESQVAADAGGVPRSIAVDAFSTRMDVAVDANFLELSNAQIAGPELAFGVEAIVERPIRAASNAGLTLSMGEIDLEQVRALLGWLPGSIRERARGIADAIHSGRIATVEVRGGAALAQWRDAMAGRATDLPRGLRVLADVEDIAIAVDEVDRLDDVSGRIIWSEGQLVVENATAKLNGAPLPSLDLSFVGIGRVLASQHRERVRPSGAVPLAGLTPLWNFLTEVDEGEDEYEQEPFPPVWIEIDHLEHPAALWPLDDVQASLEPTERGAHVIVSRALWAGVPLHGAVEFTFRPDRHVGVWFRAGGEAAPLESDGAVAGAPLEPLPEPEMLDAGGSSWASGRFEIGATERPTWSQYSARGDFRALEGEIHFEDAYVELAPKGEISGSAKLDLGLESEVPYELRFSLEDGDVETFLAQGGFDRRVATGRLDLHGALSGTIRPGHKLVAGLSGLLRMEATDGTIQRSVPPIMAVALASETLANFSSRERLRFRRCASTLSFDEGYMSSESFDLDGPDVRLFASGKIDLAAPPYQIDAEVVLFLFRQLDRALEMIPLLNVLLLGDNDNLVAAYFELVGPWEDPVAAAKPLRTLGEGPGVVLIEGIPRVVRRGMEALGDLIGAPEPLEAPGEQLTTPLAQRSRW
jgi:hypothetical protein